MQCGSQAYGYIELYIDNMAMGNICILPNKTWMWSTYTWGDKHRMGSCASLDVAKHEMLDAISALR